jgi:hypothetical protein
MLPLLYPMLTQIFEGQEYMHSEVIATESASPNVLFFPNVNHFILGKYVSFLYLKAGLPLQWGLTGGAFIGYTVIFLCVYTMAKLRYLKPHFWIIALSFFLLLSFGPYLHLFSKVYTSIPLPYQLFQRIPVVKIVRIPIRFMAVVMFCCSVLAGYACWDIFRRIRIKKFLFCCLAVLILFESVRLYYVRPIEQVPQFYRELRQDTEPYAILELTRLMKWQHSSVRSSLFQITHGKKLFHGHVSRVPPENYHQAYALYPIFDDLLTQPREYLEQPIYANNSLRIDKDAIFDILSYYNVRYVALYSDYWHGDFQENRRRLQELFGEPLGEEFGIVLFKVAPPSTGGSVVFPGFGMFPLRFSEDDLPVRQTAYDADIQVLNLDHSQKMRIRFEGKSYALPKEQVEIYVNGKLITKVTVGDWTEISIPAVAIAPGENTIRLRTLGNGDRKYGIRIRNVTVELFASTDQ